MRFDLHRLEPIGGATFKHFDPKREEVTLVTISSTQWERMGRPTVIVGDFSAPSDRWFVEFNGQDDPTVFDGDDPVLSRSDVPAHWDELVARLGLAP